MTPSPWALGSAMFAITISNGAAPLIGFMCFGGRKVAARAAAPPNQQLDRGRPDPMGWDLLLSIRHLDRLGWPYLRKAMAISSIWALLSSLGPPIARVPQ